MILFRVFLFLSMIGFSTTFTASLYENKLREDLMANYNKLTLPRKNISEPIYLKMGIAIRAFESINQIDGTITSNVWLRYWWKDKLLSWNPSDYKNISSIAMSTNPEIDSSIWVPDIYLYNTAESPMGELDYSLATLYSDGSIIWSRPGMIKSTCVFDLKYFPYDQQVCYLKFGSWAYHHGMLNLQMGTPSIDISNLQKNDGWDLVNYTSTLHIQKYECCPEEFSDITYNFTLRRKAGYYNLNIIIPTFATAVLMLLSFIVPWDSGERISFATTVMLSIIVFLLILSESLPKTDAKPLLSEMLIGLTFFSLFVVFFTVVISSMYNYKNRKNNILTKFFFKCKCFLCNQERLKKMTSNSRLVSNTSQNEIDNGSNMESNTDTITMTEKEDDIIPRYSIVMNDYRNEVELDDVFRNPGVSPFVNNSMERLQKDEVKINDTKTEDTDTVKNKNNSSFIDREKTCEQNCEELASKLEFGLTIAFFVAFVAFSIAIFNSKPDYVKLM